MPVRPGGPLATRPLHFIWLADASGSLSIDGKIQALNNAIREAIPHMRRVADENPNATVLVRAVAFDDKAYWHIPTPTPVEQFQWKDLYADQGVTMMGQALMLVAEQLRTPPMEQRALPPVLVLLTDGQPTDNFEQGLKMLLDEPWGRKAVRLAIAIGEDAQQEPLQQFIGNNELRPLQANNPEALVSHIRWVSTAVLKSASAPASQAAGQASSLHVPIAMPSNPSGPSSAADVW
jgi:uncharacterized protein YegL